MTEVEALISSITIFVLAVFVGIEVINRVPATLHTPLMSGTNAIHGVVLVGAMIIAGVATDNIVLIIIGLFACIFGALNVVGGFVVTDRMLQMFRKRTPPAGGK